MDPGLKGPLKSRASRSQIKSGQLCLGTATPATSDMRVVGTIQGG